MGHRDDEQRGRQLRVRIQQCTDLEHLDGAALGQLVADWPELCGWWPDAGENSLAEPAEGVGHPDVVEALRRLPEEEEKALFTALRARRRGAPPKLRLSRAIYHACEAVRHRDGVSESRSWDVVSAELAEVAVAVFDVVEEDGQDVVRLNLPMVDERAVPAYLAALIRILDQDRVPGFQEWLKARIDDGVDPVDEPGRRRKSRPWATQTIRQHDETYRARLQVLRHVGHVAAGTKLEGRAPQGDKEMPLFEDGPAVRRLEDGRQAVDIRTDSLIAAPFLRDQGNRCDSGHRRRPDKRSTKK